MRADPQSVAAVVRADVACKQRVADPLRLRPDPHVHHTAPGSWFARRPDVQTQPVGVLEDPVLQLPLPLPDARDADLRDDVDPALRDEEHRGRRGPVLKTPCRRVVRQVLGIEGEGLGRREPPGDGRLQRRQEITAAIEEDAPRATAQELQGPSDIEVAAEVVQVERDHADPVVVIDEAQHPAIAGDRTDRLGIHDRGRDSP